MANRGGRLLASRPPQQLPLDIGADAGKNLESQKRAVSSLPPHQIAGASGVKNLSEGNTL